MTTPRSRNNPAQVLLVDDSPTIRKLLKHGFEAEPLVQIVADVGRTSEAWSVLRSRPIDAIVLDIDLPGQNGIDFLREMRRKLPVPVVMFSAYTEKGSELAIKALALGASDCIEKPSLASMPDTIRRLRDLIVEISGADAEARPNSHGFGERTTWNPRPNYARNARFVLIGASTGGVEALEKVLRDFGPSCPATLITQHMPEAFLQSLSRRLDQGMAPHVKLAEDGETVSSGTIYLCANQSTHMVLSEKGDRVLLVDGEKYSGHRPSIDRLFLSALGVAPQVSAAVLTGMGRDGAEGLSALSAAGAYTICQDEATSVVYGMPRAAAMKGNIDAQLPLFEVGKALLAGSKERSLT